MGSLILFVGFTLGSCQQRQEGEEEPAAGGTVADTEALDVDTAPVDVDTAAAVDQTSPSAEAEVEGAASRMEETAMAGEEPSGAEAEDVTAAPAERTEEAAAPPPERVAPEPEKEAQPTREEPPQEVAQAPADTPPAGQTAQPEQQAEQPPQEGQQAEAGGASLQVSTEVYNGWKQYAANCERCHGQDVLGSALAPDLRRSINESSVTGGGPLTMATFITTVKEGRVEKGMPPWGQILTDQQINDIHAYVTARASGKLAPGRPKPSGD